VGWVGRVLPALPAWGRDQGLRPAAAAGALRRSSHAVTFINGETILLASAAFDCLAFFRI